MVLGSPSKIHSESRGRCVGMHFQTPVNLQKTITLGFTARLPMLTNHNKISYGINDFEPNAKLINYVWYCDIWKYSVWKIADGGTYLEILCVLRQRCLDFIDLSSSLLREIRRMALHVVSKFLDRKNIKLERDLLITLHTCIFFLIKKVLSCPFSGREKKIRLPSFLPFSSTPNSRKWTFLLNSDHRRFVCSSRNCTEQSLVYFAHFRLHPHGDVL